METFETIYKSNSWRVIARIMRALHCNKQLAEDLNCEVFIKVAKYLNTFDETKSSFNTWLNMLTNNVIIDYTRSKESKMKSKSRKNIEDHVDSEGNVYFQVEGSVDMQSDVNLELSDLELLIQKTLSSFNEVQQKVCKLQMQGLQMQEIAKELEIPEGTVKVYIFRFRKEVKSKLEKVY